MVQTWNDLLFAHWPVSAGIVRPLVPSALSLDTFDGQCWVAVAPFHMSGIRARGLPPIPGLSAFPELNLRTYVTLGGKPGVYFFSLDASRRAAVWAARATYRLPYFHARMKVDHDNGWVTYTSCRNSSRNSDATFRARYREVGAIQLREPGTLEPWLTERYCLYTTAGNDVFRAEIHHPQWPLQDAEAEIIENTMASAAGIRLPDVDPVLHFSKKLQVLIWPLRKVAG
jgi:uncharacterized protein YqjF (DUF2071 family)